jgi:hypothetical protein
MGDSGSRGILVISAQAIALFDQVFEIDPAIRKVAPPVREQARPGSAGFRSSLRHVASIKYWLNIQ